MSESLPQTTQGSVSAEGPRLGFQVENGFGVIDRHKLEVCAAAKSFTSWHRFKQLEQVHNNWQSSISYSLSHQCPLQGGKLNIQSRKQFSASNNSLENCSYTARSVGTRYAFIIYLCHNKV